MQTFSDRGADDARIATSYTTSRGSTPHHDVKEQRDV